MDPITGRWVIIATERAKRPIDLQRHFDRPKGNFCPFCAGNEHATPDAIETIAEVEPWDVRVIPNKFPALRVEGELAERSVGLYTELNGIGAHEVIVESPEHAVDFASLSIEQIRRVFTAWRSRMRDLKNDPRLRCAMVFKNHGAQAGASLEHAHSQLIALPLVPQVLQEELTGSRLYFEETGRNVFMDIIAYEREVADRVVYENEHIIALCPYASRSPFEVCFYPTSPQPRFEDPLADGTMAAMADALLYVSAKMNAALDHPPYNLMVHSAPYDGEPEHYPYFSWHIELVPTLTTQAGFELSTGCTINPTPPELAAAHLRDVDPKHTE